MSMRRRSLSAGAAALVALLTPLAATAACDGAPYELPKPFFGAWTEIEIDEAGAKTTIGEVEYAPVSAGCGFAERFRSTEGYEALGLAYLDRDAGVWVQIDVGSEVGDVVRRFWYRDRGAVVIENDPAYRRDGGPPVVDRIRLTFATDDRVDVIYETSPDFGRTWWEDGRGFLERVK